jgi:hypothetical protein
LPREDTVENTKKLIRSTIEDFLWEATIVSTNIVLGTVDVSIKGSGVLVKNIKVLESVAMNSITKGATCLIIKEAGGRYVCLGTYSPNKAKKAGAEAGSILGIPIVKSEYSDGYVMVYDSDNKQLSLGDVNFNGIPALLSTFVTLSADADLTNERVLTAGGGIAITDGGAGNAVTVAVQDALATEVNISDAGGYFASTTVEGALQEMGLTHGIEVSGGPPNLTFSTSNVAGSALTVIATDATIALFDANNPAQLTPDIAASAGSAGYAARRDHVHNVPAAVVGSIVPDDTASEGTASSFARSDHTHGILAAAPDVNLSVSSANAEGDDTKFSRNDHTHAITSSANPGAAASLLASDASGLLQLTGLGIGATPSANQIVFPASGIITTASGDLEITPVGDIILDPQGNDVLPQTNYDINLGSYTNKYLSLHAAELRVNTLVAADVLATIGGRIWVCPTTKLTSDLGSGDSTITVEHSNLQSGDILHMEGNSNIEFLSVDSVASGTGPYTYAVTRDLDGSGANDWYAGDAIANTGTTGDGSIELYSERSAITGSTAASGPTVVGWQRNSTTFNDLVESWAIGNLDGLYGKTEKTIGLGLGPYTSGRSFVTIDDTGGIDLRHRNVIGTEMSLFNVAVNGDVRMGNVGAGSGNFFWDYSEGKLQLRNNTTPVMSLDAINSQFSFGQNIAVSGQTSLIIMGDAGVFNSESLGAGDVLFGDNSAFRANMLWDKSEGQLKFRGGILDQVIIDANGQMLAGGGEVIVDSNGVTLLAGEEDANVIKWVDTGRNLAGIFSSKSALGPADTLTIFAQYLDATYTSPQILFTCQPYMGYNNAQLSIKSSTSTVPAHIGVDAGYLFIGEQSADPSAVPSGYGSLWVSNGSGSGDDGDLMFESEAGGKIINLSGGLLVYSDYDMATTRTYTYTYFDSEALVSVPVPAGAVVVVNAACKFSSAGGASYPVWVRISDGVTGYCEWTSGGTEYATWNFIITGLAAATYTFSIQGKATTGSSIYITNPSLTVLVSA